MKSTEVLYNNKSRSVIVVEARLISEDIATQDIIYRHAIDKIFNYMPKLSDGLVCRNVISCPDAPAILFGVWAVEDYLDGSQNWSCIKRLDLETNGISTILSAGEVPIPEDYVDVWISALIAVLDIGRNIVCSVGLKK